MLDYHKVYMAIVNYIPSVKVSKKLEFKKIADNFQM